MQLYRIVRKRFAIPLSGKGAALAGGRWNLTGSEMIYTAGSRALALVETLVHINRALLPADLRLLTLYIPDAEPIHQLSADALPVKWDASPYAKETQQLGSAFLTENKYLLLRVPSVLVKDEFNVLINPLHKHFGKVRVLENEPLTLDPRL